MTIEGVDYSFDRPRPWVLWAHGKRFAIRYVGAPSATKHLTYNEALSLTTNGLAIVCVCEGAANDIYAGRGKGQQHANLAVTNALQAAMPLSRPIYFAFDHDPTSYNRSRAFQYFRGVTDVISPSRVGIYGGYAAMEWARRYNLATWFWQTYAWSYGRLSSLAHIYQYRNNQIIDGAHVDLDQARKNDYGQWYAGAPRTPSVPASSTSGRVTTGWDFHRHVDSMSGHTDYVRRYAEAYASATENLSR